MGRPMAMKSEKNGHPSGIVIASLCGCVWVGLQTRLLYFTNKASLECKQGFFGMQTRLVFKQREFSLT